MHISTNFFAIPLAASIWPHITLCSPLQAPLQVPSRIEMAVPELPKDLRGRFLHITDMHPDPHYKPYGKIKRTCHGKKTTKKKKQAGYWGTPFKDCDSPLQLINHTLNFLEENWADEIDFVIWTGDNARHDEDPKIPRTLDEIFDLNREMASKMQQVFASRGIPVVPSLGNNDISPHNLMTPGPNIITNEFSTIWNDFIPPAHREAFRRGAYYAKEVIPDEVAVIALNTMYFYDSNKAAGGCPYQDRDDPGNIELDWLEEQLQAYRGRDMQVWLSGHVPPSPGNYFSECYVRYVELALRFQDTILGHLYGHMNLDYFSFLEEDDLQIILEDDDDDEEVDVTSHSGLYETLIAEFAELPKPSKEEALDGLAVVNVAPAVVPNPYLPAFRVFSYNVSESGMRRKIKKLRDHRHRKGRRADKKRYCGLAQHKETWKCNLNEPRYIDPEAPSRSNQLWTPLGYAQYYMPDLVEADERHAPHFELEYVTYPVERLHPREGSDDGEFRYPVPVRQLPGVLRRRGGRMGKSEYAPYEMEDLTIGSWVTVGRRLGRDRGLQEEFRKYMYVSKQE